MERDTDSEHLRAEINRLADQVRRLAILMDGDPQWNQIGVTVIMQSLNRRMDRLESRLLMFNIVSAVVMVLLILFLLIIQTLVVRVLP